MKKIAGITLALLALSAGLALAQQITVAKLAVGTDIKKDELIGQAKSFSAEIPGVYCWAKLSVQAGTKLKLVWTLNKVPVNQSVMEIPKTSDSYIFTAFRRVSPGSWTVELQDGTDQTLAQTAFKVK